MLKSALSKKTEEWRERGKKLKVFDGLDPDDARDAIKRIAELGDEPDIEAEAETLSDALPEAEGLKLADPDADPLEDGLRLADPETLADPEAEGD